MADVPTMDSFLQVLNVMRSQDASVTTQMRRQAEQQYNNFKKQPDFIVRALAEIIQQKSDTDAELVKTKEFAVVLLRRLFMASPSDDNKQIFIEASQDVQKMVGEQLLQSYDAEPDRKVRKAIGQSLVTLARFVFCAPTEDTDEYNENNWPDVVKICLKSAMATDNKDRREDGLALLVDLVPIFHNTLLNARRDMSQLVEGCFADDNNRVKFHGIQLVCAMVVNYTAKQWKPLQPCLPIMLRVVEVICQTCSSSEDDPNCETLKEIFSSFEEVASFPDGALFFKPKLGDIAKMMSEICAAKENLPEGVRKQGLEFFITLAEKKPKLCVKEFSAFPAYLIKAAMDFMVEIEEHEDWKTLMDDEEDDDDEEIYKYGGEVIDRTVCCFTIDVTKDAYFQAIATYVQREKDWKSIHAGLSAISEGVEYVEEDEHLEELMKLCLAHCGHDHYRVRAQAWHALSRIIGDHKELCANWHEEYMKQTFLSLEDPVERVQSKNLSAFLYFGELLESVDMEKYAHEFITRLVKKINTSQHRGVIEECITSIAVVAGSIMKDFGQYYDHIMPLLKNFIIKSTDEKETRLRGKSFECMSLFGVAVGKKKFEADVEICMQSMLGTISHVNNPSNQQDLTQLQKKNADILKDYLKDAIERIAQVMEKDFAKFLPYVLPIYLNTLDVESHNLKDEQAEEIDEDEIIPLGSGARIKSQQFVEMAQAAETLSVIISCCKDGFIKPVSHIKPVAEALMKLYETKDEMLRAAMEDNQVLERCNDVWAEMVGVLAKEDADTCKQFVQQFCIVNIPLLDNEKRDADSVCIIAKGIASVIKAACPDPKSKLSKQQEYKNPIGYLDDESLKKIAQITIVKIDEAHRRREDVIKKMNEWHEGAEDDDVEGEKNDLEDDDQDHDACLALSELLGALMLINSNYFVQNILQDATSIITNCLDEQKIKKNKSYDVATKNILIKKNKILAYFLACDIVEFLKDSGLSAWNAFMQTLFGDLDHKDFEVRHAASYCVFLAALLPSFQAHTETVAAKIAPVVKNPKKYGKSQQNKYVDWEEINCAKDNSVAALFSCLSGNAQFSANNSDMWDLVFKNLPLNADTEVGLIINQRLIDSLTAGSDAILGPNKQNLPKILNVLGNAYQGEAANEELNTEIKDVIGNLPGDVLQGIEGAFDDKQKKKFRKIMDDFKDKQQGS